MTSRFLNAARALTVDVTPLRNFPAYRALWLGQLISQMGTQMRYVAVPFQIYELTRSSVAVGLLGLVEVGPLILFSIVGGAIADRMDRRKLMIWGQWGLIASSLMLAFASLSSSPSLISIYALTALASAFGALDRPASSAMLPNLVSTDQLPAAIALRQVLAQTTQIVGPAAGGLLIAAMGGVALVYLTEAVTFGATLIALRWVPNVKPEVVEGQSPLDAIREGLRFSFRTPLILSIFAVDLVAMIFGMPRAVFPALATDYFGLGAAGLGLLYSATAAGALIAALSSGWVGRVERQGLAVIGAVLVWAVAITTAGISLWSLPLTLLLLALAGGADVVSAIFRHTILQEETPDHLRGRMTSVSLMVTTGGPRLGDVEAGLMAGLTSPAISVVLGGVACLVGTLSIASFFPALPSYRRRTEPPERPGRV